MSDSRTPAPPGEGKGVPETPRGRWRPRAGNVRATGLANTLRRFLVETDGNIAIIAACLAAPMLFLAGMGIDYGFASTRASQLQAYADAAALAAVTPRMMAQNTSVARDAARNMFDAQSTTLTDVRDVVATVAVEVSGTRRTATVDYTAAYVTNFPGFLGETMQLAGSATATSALAPKIDFHLLLDTSPSMAIAATQQGIDRMVANTPSQGGCAFGCHQIQPQADNLGNPGGIDNYQLARNLNVPLRMDLVRQAAVDLMTTAQETATANNATYRAAIYGFNYQVDTLRRLTSNLGNARRAAGRVEMLRVCKNNHRVCGIRTDDTDTDIDLALQTVNAAMADPGSGTNSANDRPQAVLFLVSDGLHDAMVGGRRQISVMNTDHCTAIKRRGIRIAVLYTEYLPLPTNWFYNANIAPFQETIAPTMASCASPGLFFQVTTGDDISAALQALFHEAIRSSYLSR